MLNRFLAVLLSTTLAGSPVFAQTPASMLTRIGAAAAVRGLVNAQAPDGSVGRVIGSGKPLYLNDHVTSGPDAHLQVLLLDETVFTLGPNSDMVLDEFVYDPKTNVGKITAGIAKGTFRFVSGKIAHNQATDNVTIKLPVGTMGIRGTIGAGEVGEHSATIILAGPGFNNNAGENPGSITVSNGGHSVTLDHPGFGTTITGNLPPTNPVNMGGQLGGIMGALGTKAGGSTAGGSSSGGSSQQQAAVSGGGSATQASGQGTAVGGQTALGASSANQITQTVNNIVSQATQDAANVTSIMDGITLWQQLLTIPASAGQQQWQGSGNYTCTGGTCGGSTTGTFGFYLTIDFGAQTIAGSGTSVYLNSSGSFAGDSTSLSATTFAGHPGNSQVVGPTGNNSFSNAYFNGTTLNLNNVGGVIAQTASISVVYHASTGENIASGAATATSGARVPYNP